MYINELNLTNFRNYDKQEITLNPKINIFYGDNAQGKTNILEAIFLGGFGKSFRTSKEKEMINIEKDFLEVNIKYQKSDREGKIRIQIENKKHIEVTTLLLPKENTDDETLLEIAKFLSSIDKSIPLHVSRYFPRYKMEEPPTSLEEMRKGYKLVKKYLDNVYLGNLSEEEYKYCIEG